MKRQITFFLGLLASTSVWAKSDTLTGDLIVHPKQDQMVASGPAILNRQAAIRLLGNEVRSHIEGPDLYVVHPAKSESLRQLENRLKASGLFDVVTTDKVLEPAAAPNDPFFDQQWHLTQISAPRAWDFVTGLSAPIVAVVDAGCDTTHPDLAPAMVPGYNTISGLAQVNGGAVSDIGTTGHGTRCMSIAVARGNNSVGISGVGWNLRGMPIRATNNANGSALLSELLEGVTWAVQSNAKAVSVSFSGVSDPSIETTGAWARTQGALLVWAAGNDNLELFDFDHRDVTIVGGTDQNDEKIALSNFGSAVDCYAPATQVYTARKGGLYGFMPSGTSAAAPQVAATFALMMEREPLLSPNQIEKRLLRRCRDLGAPGRDTTWGWGRLNAGLAASWPTRTYDYKILPLPTGFLWATGLEINNNGTIVGLGSDVSDAQGSYRTAISWQDDVVSRTQYLGSFNNNGAPNTFVFPMKLNDLGQVLIDFEQSEDYDLLLPFNSGAGAGYQWDLGNGNLFPWAGAYIMGGINKYGRVVALRVQNNSPSAYWCTVKDFNDFSVPPPFVPPVAGDTYASFTDINDFGEICGWRNLAPVNVPQSVLYQSQPFVFQYPSSYQYLSNSFGASNRARLIGNDGRVYGESGPDPVITNMKPVVWDSRIGPAAAYLTWPYGTAIGSGNLVTAVNELGDIVGRDYNLNPPVDYFFDGIRTGKIRDMLTRPLPAGYSNLRISREAINDKGELVGYVTNGITSKPNPVKLTPNDGAYASIGFGADGENPVYIGSIPPTLNVTFTDAAGQAIAGTTTNVSYQSATGRVPLQIPPQVTGSFRMYIRANRDVIPGYYGTRFLPRLLPPMNESAAPRDVAFLPTGGSSGPSGEPTLELFAGDVDGSNEIDAADIDMVIANFGRVDGDPTWNPDADCDGSGEIDAADIDRVIANFGLVGDPEP